LAYNAFKTTEFGDETYLFNRIRKFQNTVNRVSLEGFREPKIPTWWTLFEEGTLKSFITEYKKKVCIFIDNQFLFIMNSLKQIFVFSFSW